MKDVKFYIGHHFWTSVKKFDIKKIFSCGVVSLQVAIVVHVDRLALLFYFCILNIFQLKEKLRGLFNLYFYNLFLTRPKELESDAEGSSAQVN